VAAAAAAAAVVITDNLPFTSITNYAGVSYASIIQYYRCFDKSHSFLPCTSFILLHFLTWCQFLCCRHGNTAHTCTRTHLGEVQLYFGYNGLGQRTKKLHSASKERAFNPDILYVYRGRILKTPLHF